MSANFEVKKDVIKTLSINDVVSLVYNKDIGDYWIQIKFENGRLYSFWYSSHDKGHIGFIFVDQAKDTIESLVQMEEL